MADSLDRKENEFTLLQLLPNVLTITAICAGLTAIRFGVQGNYTLAVQLVSGAVVIAAVGVLGRVLSRPAGPQLSVGGRSDVRAK